MVDGDKDDIDNSVYPDRTPQNGLHTAWIKHSKFC